jgi:hypothetical protein
MNKNLTCTLVVAFSAVLIPNIASAFYAAHMGSWTSRDPYAEVMWRTGMTKAPEVGARFFARDRYNPTAAYHDGMNLYEYVRSSPVKYTDAQGTKITCIGNSGFCALGFGGSAGLFTCSDDCGSPPAQVLCAGVGPGVGGSIGVGGSVGEGCLSDGLNPQGGAQFAIGPIGGGISVGTPNLTTGPPQKQGSVGVGFGTGIINDALGFCWTVSLPPGPPQIWPPRHPGMKL